MKVSNIEFKSFKYCRSVFEIELLFSSRKSYSFIGLNNDLPSSLSWHPACLICSFVWGFAHKQRGRKIIILLMMTGERHIWCGGNDLMIVYVYGHVTIATSLGYNELACSTNVPNLAAWDIQLFPLFRDRNPRDVVERSDWSTKKW